MKTGSTPADVYCGIGQLAVYPILLPDLASHARILLLPDMPADELTDALEKCGVELHWFRMIRRKRKVSVNFSKQFLRRCGVPEQRLDEFLAI